MRRSALLLAGALFFLMQTVPVWAHTEFESSTPADQASVDVPVSEITVVFTLPVTIVGNGFEVLDPEGNVVRPTVESSDDATFTLTLSEPLVGGEVGVRYEVTAEDGHVLAGGFSFIVTASASTSTTTTTAEAMTTRQGDGPTATAPATTTVDSATSTSDEVVDGAGSTAPLLLGLGAVVVLGAGLYAGMRSRS